MTRTPSRTSLRGLAIAAIPLSLLPGLAPAQGKGEQPPAAENPQVPDIIPSPRTEQAPAPATPLAPHITLAPGTEQPLGLQIPRNGEGAPAVQLADDVEAVAEEPPGRVGRLSRVQGSVAFRQSPDDEWTAAAANTALVAGNALYTEAGARAAIQVNQIAIAIEAGSDLQIARLDDEGLIATLPRGAIDIQAEGLLDQEKIEVVTPQASLLTSRGGRYLVEAGAPVDAPGGFRPARFSVLAGEAVITHGELQQALAAGQMLTFTDQGPVLGRIAAPPPLVAWAGGLGRKAIEGTPQAARQMTGAEDLGRYGRWETQPEYGDIWYPTVEASYVPYRDGRWVWRQPWGWTWLDERPWGFAPFHYGRWVRVGPRWGWAPRPVAYADEAWRPRRPIWAPALVAFVGVAARGPRGPGIGWVPLGPREAYYPAFRASPAYVRNVNLHAVRDPRALEGSWRDWRRAAPPPGAGPRNGLFAPPPRAIDAPFLNRAAFSALPASDMIASRPTRGRAQSLAFGGGGIPVLAAPPPPTGLSLGVTPVVAGRIGLPAGSVTVTPQRRGPPPQTHVPLAALVTPLPAGPSPGPGVGPGPGGGPGAGSGAGPRPGPGAPGPQPGGPQAGAPDRRPAGLGTAGAVAGAAAAGAAVGLGAAAVIGRQPSPGAPGATQSIRPGEPGRPSASGFGPAPGVTLQPGIGRFGGQPPGSPGGAPATPGFAAPSRPGGPPSPGFSNNPGRFTGRPSGVAPSDIVAPPGLVTPGVGAGRPLTPGLSEPPGGKPGSPAGTTGVRPQPGSPGPASANSGFQQPGIGQAPGLRPQQPTPQRPGFTGTAGQQPGFRPAQPGPQTQQPGFATQPGQPQGFRRPQAAPQPGYGSAPGQPPGFRPQQSVPSAPQPGFGGSVARQPEPRPQQQVAPPPQVFRPQPSAAPPPQQQQPAFRPPPPAIASPPPQRQAAPPPPPPRAAPASPAPAPAARPAAPPPRRPGDPPR